MGVLGDSTGNPFTDISTALPRDVGRSLPTIEKLMFCNDFSISGPVSYSSISFCFFAGAQAGCCLSLWLEGPA
jgi:hypothetical protein